MGWPWNTKWHIATTPHNPVSILLGILYSCSTQVVKLSKATYKSIELIATHLPVPSSSHVPQHVNSFPVEKVDPKDMLGLKASSF